MSQSVNDSVGMSGMFLLVSDPPPVGPELPALRLRDLRELLRQLPLLLQSLGSAQADILEKSVTPPAPLALYFFI